MCTGPPADAPLGERVTFEGVDQGTAATGNQLNKSGGKKALEAILTCGDLCTSADCEASWRGRVMMTTKGAVKVDSLVNAAIK